MGSPTSTLKIAYELLNETHVQYLSATSKNSKSFYALKLQVCIFHYESCQEMVSFLENEHEGFAGKVALKKLLHLLLEYERGYGEILKDIRDLATSSSRPFPETELRAERKTWKAELEVLRGLTPIRNKATAHMDKDRTLQFELLGSIDPETIMRACRAVLSCNTKLLLILRELGSA